MRDVFRHIFGRDADAVAQAPGRVNLIGDHTDYAEGFCLPMPLRHVTEVAMAKADAFRGHSIGHGETVVFDPFARSSGTWSDYVAGPLQQLALAGIAVEPVEVLIRSAVPQGAGVSSSAALEVAVIRAYLALSGAHFDNVEIALMAQRAENQYCGVQCGILDQMACSVGVVGSALLLDCRTNVCEQVVVPDHFCFAVVHCGQERRLADGVYNARREAVEEAARVLGVSTLRDATPELVTSLEDAEISCAARHVVSENARVLSAVPVLQRGDAEAFGRLMIESHWSLANDFKVSVPSLNHLVETAVSAGAYGARLTGAGFGGCIVALVPSRIRDKWWERVKEKNPAAWIVQI